jgi:hypothetical protein
MNPSLNPTFYLSQIRDEMEEGFPGILKKRLEIFAMNDNTDIRCMIQDLKALHHLQFRLLSQFTQPVLSCYDIDRLLCHPENMSPFH